MVEAAMKILGGLAVAYGLLALGACAMQDSLLYFPDRSRPDPAAFGVPDMVAVALRTGDGLTLNAWYQPAAERKPTLVLLHGNAGHIGHRGFKVRPWLDAGLGVLLVEWRGFGGNAGKPGEAGFLADGRAALDFLKDRGVPPARTALYGESLGTGIAVMLAAERSVAALVLEAPYSSIADLGATHYPFLPVRWLLRDKFDALAVAPRVAVPTLVVHGEADDIIPPRFGRALYAALPGPKQAHFIAAAGHNDLTDYGLNGLVLAFLQPR